MGLNNKKGSKFMEISVLFESFEAGNAAEEKRATGIKCCIKSSWFYFMTGGTEKLAKLNTGPFLIFKSSL